MRPLPVLQGLCTRCGDCCRVVTLTRDVVERIKSGELGGAQAPGRADSARCGQWIRDELTELTPAEAEQRLPGITAEAGADHGLYRCSNFDEATNLCRRHDDKPSICADFPWYGQSPSERPDILRGLPRCGYAIDQVVRA